MKTLRLVLYCCLFFAVGESLIRIDMAFDLLDNAPKIIDIKIEESSLINKINGGSFVKDSSQIRILVLGDSYIYGGGIDPANKFSKKLSMLLKNNDFSENEILVLDVSRPSNNTLDNYNAFLYYQKRFEPQFVFWAYNFNDVLGPMELDKKVSHETKEKKSPPKRVSKKRVGLKSIVKQLYSFSELTRYLSAKVQKELKIKGIIPPGGDFHYLTKEAYLQTSKKWKNTQKALSEVSQICKSNESEFILYKMPEFNLLQNPNLFSLIDETIFNYCNSIEDITYINGSNDFQDDDGDKFKISKYDGHPNEKAHMKIAKRIFELIKEQLTTRTKLH